MASHITFRCSRRGGGGGEFSDPIGDTKVPEMTESIRITFGKCSEIFWLSSRDSHRNLRSVDAHGQDTQQEIGTAADSTESDFSPKQ